MLEGKEVGEKHSANLIFFFLNILYLPMGASQVASGKESACQVGDVGSIPCIRKIPWRRK